MERQVGFDYLKVFLTFLVVIHHVVMVYGGAAGWYWREVEVPSLGLIAFNTVNQSFFMGLFFMLSGYFVRASLEGKSVARFIRTRAVRLGIPLLVYFFVVSPFTVALAHPEAGGVVWQRMFRFMAEYRFEPGPLWFLLALLLFSCVYALVFTLCPAVLRPMQRRPRIFVTLAAMCVMGLFTYVVRLIFPVGEKWMWLQLGYFPMYILLFWWGAQAYSQRLLSEWRRPFVIFCGCSVLLLVMGMVWVMMHPVGHGPFEGGVNYNALFYALWEPFVAGGIIVVLLYVFSRHISSPSRVVDVLARSAYGVFVIHPPIVVAVSMYLFRFDVPTWSKVVLNSSISLALCVLLKLPRVSKVL